MKPADLLQKEETSSLQEGVLQNCVQDEVPLLDLTDFQSEDPEKRNQFIQEMGGALNRVGFVIIKNHQISTQKINAAYESAQAFFDLPHEVKQQYQGIQLNRGYKGYSPERTDKKADLQEYWHVGPNFNSESTKKYGVPEVQNNIWPTEVDSFASNLTILYEEIAEKCQPLLKACSIYMGKESNFLSHLTDYGDSIMRVIHYLPSPENQTGQTTWKAPHKDPNLLTVIAGISMEGLEVQLRDGTWIAVPYHPDTIVVSSSNMLESLSNGLIRSAPHRVIIKDSKRSRFSIPFFYHVQRNLSIAPQPESILKTNGIPHYPEQTAEASLTDHQWFIPQKHEAKNN